MMPGRTPKGCRFCSQPALKIDYKDAKALRPFLTDRAKIVPRRQSALCAYHQRQLTKALKRARILGIIPFTADQREIH